MSAPILRSDTWTARKYDMIIDVRSPSEFMADHIPGAVNMPVLSDVERAEVGIVYKQESRFIARRKGAIMVARNIASHLENILYNMGPNFRPLIYCWRGGQRSKALAQICSEIGWKSYILDGGYKTYRRSVIQELEKTSNSLRLIVIGGRTGSAKTDVLAVLGQKGAQVLDLEDLASHRGSLLGEIKDKVQPSQRFFETKLNDQLLKFKPNLDIFVECESSRIGAVQIPSDIWKKIIAAPMISISTPDSARASYLLKNYSNLTKDISHLNKFVLGMLHRHGRDRTIVWQKYIEMKNWKTLIMDLLENHYDPAYDRSILRHDRKVIAEIFQKNCDKQSVEETVIKILSLQKDRAEN
jgi:tRNA 2-selenouridine synthase